MGTMTTKERILQTLQELPEDASYEDAIERLVFVQMIEERVSEADSGATISHEEVRRRVEAWLR